MSEAIKRWLAYKIKSGLRSATYLKEQDLHGALEKLNDDKGELHDCLRGALASVSTEEDIGGIP